jgi:plastocyanin
VAGMKRLLRLAGAAAALTLAIAACSSGNDSSDSAAPSVATTTSAAAPTTSAPAGGEVTSSDDNGGGSGSGQGADSGTISIKDFAFGAPLEVRPGAMIKVTNMDIAAHDLASDDQGNFRTPLLNQGESATFTAPTQPGTYKFSCTVHAQMQGIGTLIVHD